MAISAEASAARAHINKARYEEMYKHSIDDPEGFWAEQAESLLSWFKPWDKVMDFDYHKAEVKWFSGAKLNAAYNCIDRHLDTRM